MRMRSAGPFVFCFVSFKFYFKIFVFRQKEHLLWNSGNHILVVENGQAVEKKTPPMPEHKKTFELKGNQYVTWRETNNTYYNIMWTWSNTRKEGLKRHYTAFIDSTTGSNSNSEIKTASVDMLLFEPFIESTISNLWEKIKQYLLYI